MTTAKNKALSSARIVQAVAERVGEDVSLVKEVLDTLVTIGHKELRWNGIFVLPGFAKFVVVTKPARSAREGINPFTKQRQWFAARSGKRTLRATPVKAIKDAARCGAIEGPVGQEVGDVAQTPGPGSGQEGHERVTLEVVPRSDARAPAARKGAPSPTTDGRVG